ncbi:hypothetical protein P378_10940 [Desulforamulus profundi]|uniref:Tetratricopeptide repeat protein n=1 Tax=Desulforamulus profundi TaxID=1383067 RepID=A0A2C6MAU6_9FIRM|nr:tetratricopeptide repeat protein [Desulforamulus profundi]PHJ38339.1 hypothetical protein P378_10940 [Desulforamulus profundi]
MIGRDSTDHRELFSHAIKAMKNFDEAVNYSPDDIEIRLLRANHSLRLPEAFFCRTATAITDLEYLVERYQKDRGIFSIETYWQVLYDLGRAYERLGMEKECAAAWETLLSLNPDAKYRELIRM